MSRRAQASQDLLTGVCVCPLMVSIKMVRLFIPIVLVPVASLLGGFGSPCSLSHDDLDCTYTALTNGRLFIHTGQLSDIAFPAGIERNPNMKLYTIEQKYVLENNERGIDLSRDECGAFAYFHPQTNPPAVLVLTTLRCVLIRLLVHLLDYFQPLHAETRRPVVLGQMDSVEKWNNTLLGFLHT